MMRENGVHKRIRYSDSDNQGRNWSTMQETDLPNPGLKVNVVALKMVVGYWPTITWMMYGTQLVWPFRMMKAQVGSLLKR